MITQLHPRILDDHEFYGIRDTMGMQMMNYRCRQRIYGESVCGGSSQKDDARLILERQVIRAERKDQEGIPGRGKIKHEVCKTISLI